MTDYTQHNEWELVEACRQNKRQAQQELYQRFVYMMKGICLRYGKDEVEAEDILQDAFVQAFRSLDQFSGTAPLGAWLRKITVNKALEVYRRNKKVTELKAFLDWGNNNPVTPDTAIEQLGLEDLLQKIQHLPVGFRTVFNLYSVEGYNHKEIGEMLGISEGTSKSQYSRARLMLRNMIEKELSTEQKNLGYAR
jgi:RNA polymerase sigma-70 factor (ECF subfamily)